MFCTGKRRLLVFINPVGGAGKAVEIFEQEVAPLFRHARIDVDVIRTLCLFMVSVLALNRRCTHAVMLREAGGMIHFAVGCARATGYINSSMSFLFPFLFCL